MQKPLNIALALGGLTAGFVAGPTFAETISAETNPNIQSSYEKPPQLLAQVPQPPTVIPPTQPFYATPAVEFGFAPRLWYFFQAAGESRPVSFGANGLVPSNTFATAQNVGYDVPMAGGVVSARVLSMPDTSFSLSVLYGHTTLTSYGVCVAPPLRAFRTGATPMEMYISTRFGR